MPHSDAFPAVFLELRRLLATHAPPLTVAADATDDFQVVAAPSAKYPAGHPFGVVRIKKNYVSYHLFPIYMFPDLLEPASDALRKRMQGKNCFNFASEDPALFEELGVLTAAGLTRYREDGWVSTG